MTIETAAASGWLRVCTLDEIPRSGARVVVTAAGNVAVFRTAEDRVFALDDRCPHKGGPLSQGIVFGDQVACPLHGWVIALDTGQARPPDTGCTSRYPVRVDDGEIYLAVTSQSCGEALLSQ